MKVASARSSRASGPNRVTKRAPDSLAARAKSMPSRAPRSSCSLGAKVEPPRLAPAPQLDVGALVGAIGHVVGEHVRDLGEPGIELGGELLRLILAALDLLLERADLGHRPARVRRPARAACRSPWRVRCASPAPAAARSAERATRRRARPARPPSAAGRVVSGRDRALPAGHAATSGRARQPTVRGHRDRALL